MSVIVKPTTEQDVAAAIQQARAKTSPLEIRGGGTRLGLGSPVNAATILSLSGLSGLTLYEPGALTLVAKAGTPLRDVEDTLRAEGQRLAFEPMDHRALYATTGEPSIGGVVACNISGPRRIQAGACRDSLIGARFVDGRGDIIKNGGRVMKNVTGLDLVKLMCGSHGTLGALTEVAFKVLPASETAATLAFEGLSTGEAIGILSSALGSPFEVTGAAHLPALTGSGLTALRVEGFGQQVDYRLAGLREALSGAGDSKIIRGGQHEALWRRISNVEPFQGTKKPVWRLSVRPGAAPAVEQAIIDQFDAKIIYDWGGGLIWVQVDDVETANATQIRNVVTAHGGHATLMRASEQLRASVSVFHPQVQRLAELSHALRLKFDPDGILNPGRMSV